MAKRGLPESGEIKASQIADELQLSHENIKIGDLAKDSGLVDTLVDAKMSLFYGYSDVYYINFSNTFTCDTNELNHYIIIYEILHPDQQNDQTLTLNFSYNIILGSADNDKTTLGVSYSFDNGTNWTEFIVETHISSESEKSKTFNDTATFDISSSNYNSECIIKIDAINNTSSNTVYASLSLLLSSISSSDGASVEPGNNDNILVDQDTCGKIVVYSLNKFKNTTDTSLTYITNLQTGTLQSAYYNTNVIDLSNDQICQLIFNDENPLGESATSNLYYKEDNGSWHTITVSTTANTYSDSSLAFDVNTWYWSSTNSIYYTIQYKSGSPTSVGTEKTLYFAPSTDAQSQSIASIKITITDDKRPIFEYVLYGLKYDDSNEFDVSEVNTNTSYVRYLNINYIDVDNNDEALRFYFTGEGTWLGTHPTSTVYMKVDNSSWVPISVSTTETTQTTGLRYDIETVYHEDWTTPKLMFNILSNSTSDDVESSQIYLSELPNLNMTYVTVQLQKSEEYKEVEVRFYSNSGRYATMTCNSGDYEAGNYFQANAQIIFDYFAHNQVATLKFKFGYKNASTEDVDLKYTKYYDESDPGSVGWTSLCGDNEVEDDGWVNCSSASLVINGSDWNDSDNPMDVRMLLASDEQDGTLSATLYAEIESATIDVGTIRVGNIKAAIACPNTCDSNQPECKSFLSYTLKSYYTETSRTLNTDENVGASSIPVVYQNIHVLDKNNVDYDTDDGLIVDLIFSDQNTLGDNPEDSVYFKDSTMSSWTTVSVSTTKHTTNSSHYSISTYYDNVTSHQIHYRVYLNSSSSETSGSTITLSFANSSSSPTEQIDLELHIVNTPYSVNGNIEYYAQETDSDLTLSSTTNNVAISTYDVITDSNKDVIARYTFSSTYPYTFGSSATSPIYVKVGGSVWSSELSVSTTKQTFLENDSNYNYYITTHYDTSIYKVIYEIISKHNDVTSPVTTYICLNSDPSDISKEIYLQADATISKIVINVNYDLEYYKSNLRKISTSTEITGTSKDVYHNTNVLSDGDIVFTLKFSESKPLGDEPDSSVYFKIDGDSSWQLITVSTSEQTYTNDSRYDIVSQYDSSAGIVYYKLKLKAGSPTTPATNTIYFSNVDDDNGKHAILNLTITDEPYIVYYTLFSYTLPGDSGMTSTDAETNTLYYAFNNSNNTCDYTRALFIFSSSDPLGASPTSTIYYKDKSDWYTATVSTTETTHFEDEDGTYCKLITHYDTSTSKVYYKVVIKESEIYKDPIIYIGNDSSGTVYAAVRADQTSAVIETTVFLSGESIVDPSRHVFNYEPVTSKTAISINGSLDNSFEWAFIESKALCNTIYNDMYFTIDDGSTWYSVQPPTTEGDSEDLFIGNNLMTVSLVRYNNEPTMEYVFQLDDTLDPGESLQLIFATGNQDNSKKYLALLQSDAEGDSAVIRLNIMHNEQYVEDGINKQYFTFKVDETKGISKNNYTEVTYGVVFTGDDSFNESFDVQFYGAYFDEDGHAADSAILYEFTGQNLEFFDKLYDDELVDYDCRLGFRNRPQYHQYESSERTGETVYYQHRSITVAYDKSPDGYTPGMYVVTIPTSSGATAEDCYASINVYLESFAYGDGLDQYHVEYWQHRYTLIDRDFSSIIDEHPNIS